MMEYRACIPFFQYSTIPARVCSSNSPQSFPPQNGGTLENAQSAIRGGFLIK
jgi:hypothetical protein